ncbi:zinc-binding dehydrogenase [Amycolatopsis sp. NBC_00345]|uniref:zinc-dependent alcohol dehydrogenase n=1 Tax=Amycolatopsis sp. NBC_00345 TaxID=2975955 RepID=UPI002E253D22
MPEMKTVQIDGARACSLIDRPLPSIDRDYALLKVLVAPMCNEYLAYQDGIYLERNRPDALGHEMAGEVAEAPPGSRVRAGDRVVALCGYPCGRCVPCLAGYYAHCAGTDDPRAVCGSESGECGFAQYAVKPDWMLIPIPDDVSYEHASMACCGLGPTFGAMERMDVTAGRTILITGLGAVGLGGVINAKFRGATVIGVARSPFRAALARKLGCDFVLDPSAGDVRARIAEITGGQGADGAIECSGQAAYQRLALDSAGRLGTVTFLAESGEIPVHVDEHLVQKGVRVQGSLDINLRDAPRLMEMIPKVRGQLDDFITHRFPLSRIADAFELQLARECGKVVLYPWEDAPPREPHRP